MQSYNRISKMTSMGQIGAVLLGSLVACTNGTGPTPWVVDFDFSDGTQGWVAQFSDYPSGSESYHELASGYQPIPAPLNTRSGFFVSGNNHSDDLFMYLKRRVSGFEPNTDYLVSIVVEFATDVPTGCVGVGGAPGESVYAKAGASLIEPAPLVDQSGWLRMNVDKGNQSQGGVDAVVVGNVANSTLCEQNIRRYEIKRLRTPRAVLVTADGDGSAWLFVGTDSGFEATTSLYYTRVTAEFSKQ